MIVIFYDAQDGRILECTSSPQAWIEADGRPFLEVPAFRPDWDVTHHVVDGAVVPIGGGA
ncbi:hypothetical protein [Sphingobium sp. YR768]|uniref:hypothetical protein n=1 Tax=Sphingobium sp. YR768 TaxID=1884365 RepID=UPI0008D1D0DB|nr:hypothetical protein [Sphingobium sp. YR768]SER09355.1 hypothetical protein SAMN05518866_1052 [Sphingobium sp. YR768]